MPTYSLGIDIGGTFTDIVVHDHDTGRQWSRKVLTTHDDPARAVAAGAGALLARRVDRRVPRDARRARDHALHQRADRAEGRAHGAHHHGGLRRHARDRPRAQVRALRPRHREAGAARAARPAARGARAHGAPTAASGIRSIGTSSPRGSPGSRQRASRRSPWCSSTRTRTPAHEAEAARLIAERHPGHRDHGLPRGGAARSASTSARPPRPPTPTSSRSPSAISTRWPGSSRRSASRRPLLLMLSSGGLTHVAEAERAPVTMLESGPAAGAIAAAFFGDADSGGQPARVRHGRHDGEALARRGRRAAHRVQLRGRAPAALHRGQRAADPHLDDRAHRDRRGRRQHRARSTRSACSRSGRAARAREPGPAAYGLGGTDATVTDADFCSGYLNPDYFAGGEVRVDMAARRAPPSSASRARSASRRSRRRGASTTIVNETWPAPRACTSPSAAAIRATTRSLHRRRGPGARLLRRAKLGLARVICPPSAGVASALGLLVAPARVDRVATVGLRLDGAIMRARGGLPAARGRGARASLADSGLKLETARRPAARRRPLLGQGFDLVVALPDGPYDGDDAADARAPHGRVRDRVSREVRADAAERAGRVHQHPRRGARAGGGQPRGAVAERRPGLGRRREGARGPRTSPRRAASWTRPCTTARAWPRRALRGARRRRGGGLHAGRRPRRHRRASRRAAT